MNAILRAIAQARQVPLVDLFAALESVPGAGLADDGIHLSVHTDKGWHGCWLTDEALRAGMNQRNLVTLQVLDRMRRFVLNGEPPEPSPPPLVGRGSWDDPLRIDQIPFADHGDTSTSEVRSVREFPCGKGPIEDGAEIVYDLELAAPVRLRARVFADPNVDVDLHWLDDESSESCAVRADRALEITAPSGKHRLVIDGPAAKSGSFRLTIVPVAEPP